MTPLAPFLIRDFSVYQASRALLITAGQMITVAVGWQVYSRYRDPWHLALVGLAQFLPNVVLSLFAGHVADRFSRRGIVMICALASAATAGLLVRESLRPDPSLPIIFAALALLGSIRAFSAPAGHAFLPALVPGSILQNAIVWHLIVFQFSAIVGPAIGGFVYAGTHAARVYGSSAGLYLAAFALLSLISSRPAPPPSEEPFTRALGEGLRFVWRDKRLLGAMSLDLFAVLLGGATALLPAIAHDILRRGPDVLGVLRSATSIGAGAVALVLAFRPLRRRIGAWLFGGVAVFGLATVALGLARTLPAALGCLLIMGAADMLSVTVRHTLIQVATPDAMRGRVSAVSMVFINASNELGEFESGVTMKWWGLVPAILAGGAGTLAVVALGCVIFPALRKADRYEDAPPGAPLTIP